MITESTADTHTVNGRKMARVTSILKATGISDFSELDKMPKAKRDYYMARGSGFHRLTEDIDNGIDSQFEYDPEVELYRPAYMKFLADTGFKPIEGGIEMAVSNEALGFAGRLDRLGRFPSMLRPDLWVCDYKLTSSRPGTAIQTAFYAMGLPKEIAPVFGDVGRCSVAFQKEGKYKMTIYKDRRDRDVAMAAISVFNWIKENT